MSAIEQTEKRGIECDNRCLQRREIVRSTNRCVPRSSRRRSKVSKTREPKTKSTYVTENLVKLWNGTTSHNSSNGFRFVLGKPGFGDPELETRKKGLKSQFQKLINDNKTVKDFKEYNVQFCEGMRIEKSKTQGPRATSRFFLKTQKKRFR